MRIRELIQFWHGFGQRGDSRIFNLRGLLGPRQRFTVMGLKIGLRTISVSTLCPLLINFKMCHILHYDERFSASLS